MEFSVVSIIGLAIRIPSLILLEPVVEWVIESLNLTVVIFDQKFLVENMTLALAVILVMFWNFFVNRYWTYSDVD
jgi:hypothetical protein